MGLVKITPLRTRSKKPPIDLNEIVIRVTAEEAVLVRQDFERTVETWAKKPVFIIEFAPDRKSARIYTENEIYKYVDEGTPAHIITPKAPGYPLRFNVPSSPKTRVRFIGSSQGSTGNTTVRTMIVHHPGTEARKFSEVITRAAKRSYGRKIKAAIQGKKTNSV